ncbi:hypothetical protein ACHAWF_005717 [Thalassiosira exigua]
MSESSGAVSALTKASIFVLAATTITPCASFHSHRAGQSHFVRLPYHARPMSASGAGEESIKESIEREIAAQFTIQVCTSTSCTKTLKQQGLDQYHALGEIYARAQEANLEKCMIIEDGGCQGGKNCKMGPCVAILHEDFVGRVALEGMNSNEFRERVFHGVSTARDADRVWSCMENAISLMSDEANVNNES